MPNHPAPPLAITECERASLQALQRAGTTEQRLAMRARIVLAAADGTANERIAAQLRVDRNTVLLWRGRFERERMAGLADAPRPGREPTYDRAARDRVIALTLEPPPAGTTHWSSRAMAARTGISVTTIQRIWAEANLKPHRTPSATPAATNTSSNSSGGSGSPLFALLVCLAFGSVALLMAEKQRRTVRR